MRASIVIATYNEGTALYRTVRSCLETLGTLQVEIVVADDCSTDGSVASVECDYPNVRVFRNPKRLGVSPTKHRGAMEAQGSVLIFLDAHCKPEGQALERLIDDVEECDSRAIITPEIAGLDTDSWRTVRSHRGNGYFTDLITLEPCWLPLESLSPAGRFYESPSLIGCCLGLARNTYQRLLGFDVEMLQWGTEDVDLGLKAWLMGYSILHDTQAVVGHRFQQSFENYTVDQPHTIANELRLARRNFSDSTWTDWCERARERHDDKLWDKAWGLFESRRESAERERRYLLENRRFDEYWYAEKFGLGWPFSLGMLLSPEDRGTMPEDHAELTRHISQYSRYWGELAHPHVRQPVSIAQSTGALSLVFERDAFGKVRVAKARFGGNVQPAVACCLSLACHLLENQPVATARQITATTLSRYLGDFVAECNHVDGTVQVVKKALANL